MLFRKKKELEERVARLEEQVEELMIVQKPSTKENPLTVQQLLDEWQNGKRGDGA